MDLTDLSCDARVRAGTPPIRGSARRFLRNGTASIVVSALLAGCSVSPNPMSRAEVRSQLAADMEVLPDRDQVIEGVVDLDRALVHAVLHNRGLRLKTFESALSRSEIGTTALGMLPELTAEAGYRERDDYDASTSVVLIEGEPDVLPDVPAYSISSGLSSKTRDGIFTWNLLDFGLSYVRAKQFADRHLVEAERERKAIHTISADVRAAYWKAVSAERLLPQIDPLIADAEAALAEARALEEERSVAPRQALEDQRRMLDILRLLQDLKSELAGAKVELAELMGLHPAAEFELADVRSPDLSMPRLREAISALEQAALENRPEMREAQYQTRIAAREARVALMKLLPGIRLTAQDSYEENIYLRRQNWETLGASVNFNLFNIFSIVPTERRGEARRQLAEERRLATAMTVLAQVHISAAEFAEAKDAYGLSTEYLGVARRIVKQADARVEAESAGTQDLIRERLNSLLAEIRRDRAYAAMQNSFGRVLDSVGIDLFPTDYRKLDAATLTKVVEKRFEQISRGDLPLSPPPTQEEKAAAEAAKRAAERAAAEKAAAEKAAAEKAAAEKAAAEKAAAEKAAAEKAAAEKAAAEKAAAEKAAAEEAEPVAAQEKAETPDAAAAEDCERNFFGFCKRDSVEDEKDAVKSATEGDPEAAQEDEAQSVADAVRETLSRESEDAAAPTPEAEPAPAPAPQPGAPLSAIDWLNEAQE